MAEPGLESAEDVAPTAEEYDQGQSRRRIALLAVAVVVGLIIWWILSHIAPVPSTVGMSVERSRDLLAFAGYETSVTLVPAEDKLSGRVLVQAPARGLYLTWWPVRVTCGSNALASDSEERSVAFLIDTGSSGLDLAVPGGGWETMPTDPEEVLALYYPPETWDSLMPDVLNMTDDQAAATLRRAGLTVHSHSGPSTTDVGKGRVYYQKPAPGVGIKAGQTATVWYSDGSFSILSGGYSGFPYPRPPYQKGE